MTTTVPKTVESQNQSADTPIGQRLDTQSHRTQSCHPVPARLPQSVPPFLLIQLSQHNHTKRCKAKSEWITTTVPDAHARIKLELRSLHGCCNLYLVLRTNTVKTLLSMSTQNANGIDNDNTAENRRNPRSICL